MSEVDFRAATSYIQRDLGVRRLSLAGRYGVFIVVEGPDGSGVSTIAKGITSIMSVLGIKVEYTKEPTFGPFGSFVWQSLEGSNFLERFKAPPMAALLFATDRAWHLIYETLYGEAGGIVLALKRGISVISDRYKYSSIVYQSLPQVIHYRGVNTKVRGAPEEWLWKVNSIFPPPHVVIFVMAPVEVSINRISGERLRRHLYETKSNLEAVADKYMRLAERLRREPEYTGGHALWREWLEPLGLDPDELYPLDGVKGYPIVVEVSTHMRPPAPTISEALVKTVEALEAAGLVEIDRTR